MPDKTVKIIVLILLLLSAGCSTGEIKMTQQFNGQLAPCPSSPNCVSSLADDEEHRVEPFMLASNNANCWADIISLVKALPRTQIIAETSNYLHVEVRSFLFRFVDHLELVIAQDKQRLDIRSASVTGYSDMGVNRKRVEMLRDLFVEKGLCKATHKTR